MVRQKRKKIIYVPGAISLTILPILFLIWTMKHLDIKPLTVLSVYLADTNQFKKHPEIFVKLNNDFLPKRHYFDISFTGNNIEDKIKLDFARIQIKDYVLQKDFKNGLHFKFGDSCEYWTYVKTVDALKSGGAKTFIPFDNDLWFFNLKTDTTKKTFDYPCLLCNDVIFTEPEITLWTNIFDKMKIIWKTSWSIIVAFFSFLFSVWLIRKKQKEAKE